MKFLIIGDSGVGKSCMMMRYVQNAFTTAFYTTIGVDFVTTNNYRSESKESNNRRPKDKNANRITIILLQWDTAGQ